MASLAGKKVLVTGAASGIGKACAIGFAQAGAHVIAVDLNTESLEELKSQYGMEI
ncbi:MAG: SDR family NAD(P)-dependent oxidoreductase, partial [Actinobacteria bacterium]|nr:SDR family NAD(P)-dependent oxidoreductase [Actinomycetota bacterium]